MKMKNSNTTYAGKKLKEESRVRDLEGNENNIKIIFK